MPKEIKNIGASVRARLLNLSQANRQNFDLVLTRFALERLLFRLSQSPYAERFVLKGAMLLMSWFEDPHRTRAISICWDSVIRARRPCWKRFGKSWRGARTMAWCLMWMRCASIAFARNLNMAASGSGPRHQSAVRGSFCRSMSASVTRWNQALHCRLKFPTF